MRMKGLVFLLAMLSPLAASAQTCPGCIQNSGVSQNAQFNVSSATIRGQLTVGNVVMSSITVSTVTSGVFIGSGAFITALNGSNILTGTISTTVITGAYPGITQVGTLSSGIWQGTPVGTQWGGTGQNFINISTGSIIYFSADGTMGTLLYGSPESLLQTNGASAPSWTSSPSVSGINIYGLPLTALSSGTLPTTITIASNSITYVNGASVVGNISGQALGGVGTISVYQISSGTLPGNIIASSVAVTGVSTGTYGGPSLYTQIRVGFDGRLYSVVQGSTTIQPSAINAGVLPSGVTVPAASINAGVLNAGVLASSVNVSGVVPGTYGNSFYIPQFTVGVDGRITSSTQVYTAALTTFSLTGFAPLQIVVGSSQQSLTQYSTFTLTPGGNLGVGTASPQNLLDVQGASDFGKAPNTSTFTANGSLIMSAPSYLQDTQEIVTSTITVEGNAFSVGTSTLVVSQGNVGIGTTSPLYTFHVVGNSYTSGQKIVGSTLTVQGNAFSVGTSTLTVVNGFVGISTTAPAYHLDVNGSVRAAKQVIVVGTGTIQGNAFSVGGSSFTVNGGSATVAYSMTAASFIGNGSGLTSVSSISVSGTSTGTWGSSGIIPSIGVGFDGRIISIASNSVVASSVAANTVGTLQLTQTGTSTGTWGGSSTIPSLTIGFDGRINAVSSTTVIASSVTLSAVQGTLYALNNATVLYPQDTSSSHLCANPWGGAVCIAGSTGTIVLSGAGSHYITILNAGTCDNGTSSDGFGFDWIVDGVQLSKNLDNTDGLAGSGFCRNQLGQPLVTSACPVVASGLSAGTHTVCMALCADTGGTVSCYRQQISYIGN